MASELRVNTLKDASGNNSIGMSYVANGSAKAWIDFNGTGTIAARDSFNNSSLTDNTTGDYTISYTNSMGNASYAGTGNQHNNYGTVAVPKEAQSLATGSTRIQAVDTVSEVSYDRPYTHLVIMGDLA